MTSSPNTLRNSAAQSSLFASLIEVGCVARVDYWTVIAMWNAASRYCLQLSRLVALTN